jgi:plasmid stabilization system protein ParE
MLAPRQLEKIADVLADANGPYGEGAEQGELRDEIERLAKAKDRAKLEFYRLRLSGALDLYYL